MRFRPTWATKSLNRTWAKVEILLGLVAVWIGLFLAFGLSSGNPVKPLGAVPEPGWPLLFFAIASLVLFCGGGCIALAGHRSHLYQSSNEAVALLIKEIPAGRTS